MPEIVFSNDILLCEPPSALTSFIIHFAQPTLVIGSLINVLIPKIRIP